MNLRTQMLLAGALTLAVPFIGWQSVKQLDESLRQIRVDEQALRVANARLALAESDQLQSVLLQSSASDGVNNFYAEKARYPLFVDGYNDDWKELSAPSTIIYHSANASEDAGVQVQAAERDGKLYLFIKVTDNKVVYHNPPILKPDLSEQERLQLNHKVANGDTLVLYIRDSSNEQHVLFSTVAPGPLFGLDVQRGSFGHYLTKQLKQFEANWVATTDGFQLELSTPLPERGAMLGLTFVDVDAIANSVGNGVVNNSVSGSNSNLVDPASLYLGSDDSPLVSLQYSASIARQRLQPWVTRGTRARLFDQKGQLLADINSLYDKSKDNDKYHPANGGFFNAVLFRLFAYLVSNQDAPVSPIELVDRLHLSEETQSSIATVDSETQRYVSVDNDIVLGTLTTVGLIPKQGYMLYESNEDLATAYSSSRIARLFSLLALVSLLAGIILLLFASVLSFRIRNLSKQAQRAVSADGRVTGLAESKARDEIGDLSRNLSSLLNRSAHYTQYLEALSSRLSHELRTPLSVVKTSIENMDRSVLDPQSNLLLDRAEGGADQLGAIIKALVESTRLEQTVQQAQMVSLNASEWIQGAIERYKQVYPNVKFVLLRPSIAKSVLNGTLDIHEQPTLSDGYFVTELGDLADIYLFGAPELLVQSMDKLIDNAVGFTNRARVELLLYRESIGGKSIVTLAVLNSGEPISGVAQAQIFDPMYSGRSSEAGQLHLGLGLYIVRMICHAHGGMPVLRNLPNGVLIGMQIPAGGKPK